MFRFIAVSLLVICSLLCTMWFSFTPVPSAALNEISNSVSAPVAAALEAQGHVGDSVRQHSVTTRRPYDAPIGSRLRGELRSVHGYSFRTTEQSVPAKVSVDVILDLVVAKRENGAIHVIAKFDEGRVDAGRTAHSALLAAHGAEALDTVVQVALDLDGGFRGFRFDESLDAWQRNFVRALLTPLAFPIRDDAVWEQDHGAPLGIFRARFRRDARCAPDRVERTAIALVEGGDAIDARALRSLEEKSHAIHNDVIGWLTRVEASRSVEVALPLDGVSILHQQKITLDLRVLPAVAVDYVDDGRTWQPVAGHGEDGGAFLAEIEAARQREAWKNKSFAQSIDDLRRLLASADDESRAVWEAWRELASRLSADPRNIAEIENLLRSGVDRELAVVLLAALAKDGSTPAQDLLVSLFGDPSVPVDAGDIAIALGRILQPGPAVLSALDRRARTAAVDLVGGQSLLSLGALAARSRTDVGSARARLLAMRDRMQRDGRIGLWLEALGNAGGSENQPLIEPWVAHRDPGIRAAAVAALRSVGTAEADGLLVRVLSKDRHAAVRSEALASLTNRIEEPSVRAGLRDFVESSAPEALRLQALHALARGAWSANERSWLQRIATGRDAVARDARSIGR